jgi:long-subunit acyl-CoA synthetase (AMP-forming)
LGLRAAYNRRTEKVGDRKMGSTINERFLDVVGRRGEASAFMVKRDGTWRTYSYDWMLEQAQRSAFGLRSLGFEAGNRIGILAENRPEWATTDFGAMAAGCALVPMYTTLIPDQVAYILNDSEAKAVFVSSMDHLETVLSIHGARDRARRHRDPDLHLGHDRGSKGCRPESPELHRGVRGGRTVLRGHG